MIGTNIQSIKDRIINACKRLNRDPGEVSLIAVTKTVPVERINEAIAHGITDIGENKVQEFLLKVNDLSKGVKRHFIGHLQTNKAKKAVEFFDLIQSVDSLRLAEEINKQAERLNKIQDCLLEVKVSEEETKFGLSLKDSIDLLTYTGSLENIKILGVMTMAPYFDDTEKSRPYFKQAKQIFDRLRAEAKQDTFKILSMGMSNDFEVAIQEGSNMVRIGTAIFGERYY